MPHRRHTLLTSHKKGSYRSHLEPMNIAYHRCGIRVRFDPAFLKKEEERKEEKKVHRGLFAFRGCKCGLSSLFLLFVFGFTEAVEDGGRPEERK
jgi:hypothetical protein